MQRSTGEQKLFAFLPSSHPLRPDIDRFEAELAGHRDADIFQGPGTRVVRADLNVGPVPGGGWRVATLYWSLQRRSRPGFAAGTLSYKARSGQCAWLDFPFDPRLPGLKEFLAARSDAEVLRYIPLRRITLRLRAPSGAVVVAKLKGASRFREAWKLLALVEERVARAQPGFRVPKALGIEEPLCLYFQEALPGRSLADLLDPENAATLLARLGELHRRLHALPAEGLARRTPAQDVTQAQEHAALIGLLLPEFRERVAGLAALLLATAPAETAPALCHGDPDCGQVLLEGDAWALLDFDACHAGDPYRDVAMLAASLEYHVPGLRALAENGELGARAVDRAVGAYLEAYFGGGPRDEMRLAWQRACAELHYLALELKKDRYRARSFARRFERLQAQAGELSSPANRGIVR
jgi:aminoglycoside phosphotransferase (APT) family kinase protein